MTHRIVLIIGGGIAAYKCLEVIRRLKERGIAVRTVITAAGQRFVTPLSVAALSNDHVLTDLFDLNDEREIGHIRLSRDADLVVVAPATADLIAKMAAGQANDLATSVLLATDKPVLVAPAMNPRMWLHPATRRNTGQLEADGVTIVGPASGQMAERDESGPGRLVEPAELVEAIAARLASPHRKAVPGLKGLPLDGRHVLITSGPTHEAIDPVRYIANRSSGKQGHALASAALALGANVTLVSGPVSDPAPAGVTVVRVETARQMHDAVKDALPADIAIFAAAVADWRVANAKRGKMKKTSGQEMSLKLVQNPDILKSIATLKKQRPTLVIGFAAETSRVVANGRQKRKAKGADWIVANDVSGKSGVMGGDSNEIHLITATAAEHWKRMRKHDVATKLMARAAEELTERESE